MHKRKLAPLLVAAIITAGVATGGVAGVRSYSNLNINPEPQTFSTNVTEALSTQKTITNTNTANQTNNKTQNTNSKTTNKEEEQANKNEEISNKRPNSSKQSVKPSASAESSYVHKPAEQKLSIPSNSQNSSTTESSNTQNTQNSIVSENHKNSNFIDFNSFTANHNLILPNGNILVNGTPIKEQLQNDAQIDATAKAIASGLTSNYEKAQALYVWVAKNISYNTALEQEVMNNEATTNVSAISTFNTRNGICENFSTLYAVMANDIGLSSRVVTGKGYANGKWVDHAWNEVYIPSMGWINVDCTFANSYTALVEKYNLPFNTEGLLSNAPYYNYSNQSYNYKIYTEDYFNTQDFSSSHIDGRVLAQLGNS